MLCDAEKQAIFSNGQAGYPTLTNKVCEVCNYGLQSCGGMSDAFNVRDEQA